MAVYGFSETIGLRVECNFFLVAMASLWLGLAETGTYSVLLQLSTAVYNFASAYPKSFFPSMQATFAGGDAARQREIASSGVAAYWLLVALGTAGVCAVVLPLMPVFKPGIAVDVPLYLGMTLYLALLQQHSIFCNYIISTNEISYMRGYLAAAVLGVALADLFCGVLAGARGVLWRDRHCLRCCTTTGSGPDISAGSWEPHTLRSCTAAARTGSGSFSVLGKPELESFGSRRPNSYAKRLRKLAAMNLYVDDTDYFRGESSKMGISHEAIIDGHLSHGSVGPVQDSRCSGARLSDEMARADRTLFDTVLAIEFS